MTGRFKTVPLPALPTAVRLESGFTASQLVQYADRVRTRALLEAANVCMKRIPRRMIASRMNGHTPQDAEALACAKAIHDLIEPQLVESDQDQMDLFAAATVILSAAGEGSPDPHGC